MCLHLAFRVIVLLLAVHACLFALFDLMPATELKLGGWMVADPNALQRYRENLGLTSSGASSRYVESLTRLIRGEFGTTLSGYPIRQLLIDRLFQSLPVLLVAAAWSLAFSAGLTAWSLSRRKPHGWQAMLFILRAGFLPTLITATLLKTLLLLCSWFAPFKSDSAAQMTCLCLLTGLLPACLLSTFACTKAREIMTKPFVVTLISQGHNDISVRIRLLTNVLHAVRPLMGRTVLQLISGLVFAEIIWDVPGFGRLFSEGLQMGDYALLQSWMLIVAVIVLACSTWEVGRWQKA